MTQDPDKANDSEGDEFADDEPELLSEFESPVTLRVLIDAPKGLKEDDIRQIVQDAEWHFEIEQDFKIEVSLNRELIVEAGAGGLWAVIATANVRLVPGESCTVYEYEFDWDETSTFITFDVDLPDDWEAVEWTLEAY